MHTVRSSWQIAIGSAQGLAIALYVREVAGLTAGPGWLPRAAPAPGLRGGGAAEAARQWGAWWDSAVAGGRQGATAWRQGPPHDDLAHAPALQALVAEHFADAVRWSADREREHRDRLRDPRRGLLETDLVARLERGLRRTAAFRLRVLECRWPGSACGSSTTRPSWSARR